MKLIICLFVMTVVLTACITVTNPSGEVHKLTLSGLEKVDVPDESGRKKLPYLDIEKFSGGFKANGKNTLILLVVSFTSPTFPIQDS